MSTNVLMRRRSIELMHAESYMSASPVRISEASLSYGPTADNPSHSNTCSKLKCKDDPLIARRGCTVVLQIQLSNSIRCPYTVTLTFIPVHGPRERSSMFKASGCGKDNQALWLSIDLPTTFPIGYYDSHVSVSLQGCVEVVTHMIHSAIVVLFNPWNSDDDTCIGDDNLRESYCLNDSGVIWRGTKDDPKPRLWIFGQFEPQCLDTALMLIKGLTADERRSPVVVVREIMSKIMPKESSGILLPSYSGSYGGGTQPCKWNGSTPIIQKYYRTRSTVKFGQCWVACGVSVSLLRSLGIPCRTITCYEAAVPTLGSARTFKNLSQIHRYFTPEGDPVYDLETDRIWSYQVLCECWMRRTDLPIGYDGWQVMGFSPVHPLGPLPVKAVREKQNRKMFGSDISMLLAMLHSEIHYHRVNQSYATMSNRQCTLAKVVSNKCGQMIITADPEDNSRYLDITSEYKELIPSNDKYPSPSSQYPYPPPSKDCSLNIACSKSGGICEDFTITITLTNNGPMIRTVDGRVIVISTQYNGDNPKPIIYSEFSGKITPNRDATVDLLVSSKQCTRNSSEQNMLRFFIVAKTRETQQLFIINQYHILHQPKLSITIKSTRDEAIKVGDDVRVCLSFRNILASSLSHAVFTVQVLGVCKEISYRRVILPGRQISVEFPLRITRAGNHLILANMYSDKLQDVVGSTFIRTTE